MTARREPSAGAKASAPMKLPPYKLLAVSELTPHPRNPRTHSPSDIDMLCRKITADGWTNPIAVAGKQHDILAGHRRRLAAIKLGLEMVPTIDLSHLSEAQRLAYIIWDNKSTITGAWDQDLLGSMMLDLTALQYPLDLTGFDALELDNLLGPAAGQTDPDDAPPVQAEAVSRTGDVWLLGGKHRICCGDATNPEHVAALMQGTEADLCFTSPPYAQQRDYAGGVLPWDELMRGTFGILPVKHGAQVLVNLGLVHNDGEWLPYWDGWIAWMRAEGWRRFGWYVWDQGFGLPGDWNGRLGPSHEFVFHFNREAERARKTTAKQPTSIGVLDRSHTMRSRDGTLKEFSSPKSGANTHKVADSVLRVMRHQGVIEGEAGSHPAVFPVALATEIITAFSDPGDTVFEPFAGSGTQIIAAEQNNRTCLGMEVAPIYTDVACRRFAAFTDTEPTLAADGRAFSVIAAERTRRAA
jgi:DNA modification methylase